MKRLEKIPINLVLKLKKIFHCKTYHIEMAFVLIVLVIVAIITRKGLIEWIGVVAVFLNFGYISVASRLQEQEDFRAKKKEPVTVECYKKLDYYNYSKEFFWLLYFVLLGAWSALVGIFLFLLYTPWRKFWRKHNPIEN